MYCAAARASLLRVLTRPPVHSYNTVFRKVSPSASSSRRETWVSVCSQRGLWSYHPNRERPKSPRPAPRSDCNNCKRPESPRPVLWNHRNNCKYPESPRPARGRWPTYPRSARIVVGQRLPSGASGPRPFIHQGTAIARRERIGPPLLPGRAWRRDTLPPAPRPGARLSCDPERGRPAVLADERARRGRRSPTPQAPQRTQ